MEIDARDDVVGGFDSFGADVCLEKVCPRP